MKFTLSWLKQHLETSASVQQVAEAMTMAGLEVEHVSDAAAELAPFSVAHIVSAARHPNADRLQVCQVETKDGLKEIVCGAPNARAGLWTIYAPIGAYVPGLGVTLVEKPVRGVVSNGMLCSAAELKLSEESDGILELDGTHPVGTLAAEVFALEPVIDFEVTPNRPDWLGVGGIARDLAAAGLGQLITPAPVAVPGKFPCPIRVEIAAPDACPIFAGRVIRGLKNGPSPKWLADQLTAIGLRPISALVDVTNLMSYDRARPLHVYDVAKLSGSVITARLGVAGESFKALDGKTYAVTPDQCVIADASGPLGFGGVMGGEATGVSLETTEVFLEAAWFDPIRTAQTGRTTGITSDAQYRFARGVDPAFVLPGLELATQIILDLCGGEASDVVVVGEAPAGRPDVRFDPAYVAQLSGLSLTDDKIAHVLTDLGFGVDRALSPWTVSVPSWRRDVEGKADLVEEVARIAGFDALPATPLPEVDVKAGVLSPRQVRVQRARRFLAASGYAEALTWSFLPHAFAKTFGGGADALVLANPIASELDCMRPSILPNLITATGRNAARGHGDAALFEIGPVYLSDGPKDQRTAITAVIRHDPPRHWDAGGETPLFGLKGDLLALLDELGAPTASLQLVQGQNSPWWRPGRSARLQLGPKTVIAEFGELHPSVLKGLDVAGVLVAFELILENLPEAKAKATKSKGKAALSPLQPLSRDFAFVVGADRPAGDLIRAALSADKALITEARVFDVYQGAGVPEGQKSVAVEVVITPVEATLTEAEIKTLTDKVVAAAGKLGAVLRG